MMSAEGSICSFAGEGLFTYGIIALGTLALGIFTVFSGKFFDSTEGSEEIQVPSLA